MHLLHHVWTQSTIMEARELLRLNRQGQGRSPPTTCTNPKYKSFLDPAWPIRDKKRIKRKGMRRSTKPRGKSRIEESHRLPLTWGLCYWSLRPPFLGELRRLLLNPPSWRELNSAFNQCKTIVNYSQRWVLCSERQQHRTMLEREGQGRWREIGLKWNSLPTYVVKERDIYLQIKC